MTNEEGEVARHRLQERRNRVLARAGARKERIGDELDSREIEDNENARELEDEVEAAELTRLEARSIAAIDAAMHRIDAGTYGRCVVCSRAIEPERLAAVPETTLCLEHAVAADRDGAPPA
jgi:DnaK suppressor protein